MWHRCDPVLHLLEVSRPVGPTSQPQAVAPLPLPPGGSLELSHAVVEIKKHTPGGTCEMTPEAAQARSCIACRNERGQERSTLCAVHPPQKARDMRAHLQLACVTVPRFMCTYIGMYAHGERYAPPVPYPASWARAAPTRAVVYFWTGAACTPTYIHTFRQPHRPWIRA